MWPLDCCCEVDRAAVSACCRFVVVAIAQIVQAAHCEIAILGLAMITNRCKGPHDDFPFPTHTEVLDSVKASAG